MRITEQLEFFFFGKKQQTPRPSLPLKEAEPPGRDEVEGSLEAQKSGIDHKLTSECVRLLQSLDMSELASSVTVVWNKRMRTTAGRAFWPEGKIELNPKLTELAPDEVYTTMLHELAHILAYARAGRRRISAHGAEWRQACCDLGIPGERATHTLPLPGRKMQRKWRYTCPACGEGFDRVRKLKRYAGCYACCKKYNDGYYHKKYRLRESRLLSDSG